MNSSMKFNFVMFRSPSLWHIRLFRYWWPLYYLNGSSLYSKESRFLYSEIRLHLERWSLSWNVQGLKLNCLNWLLIDSFFVYREQYYNYCVFIWFWRILTRGVEHTAYVYIYQHYRLIDLQWQSAFTWYVQFQISKIVIIFKNYSIPYH